ncbi:unnamed protein product [Dracunculus medinensis]|uniref:Uncharacterized protein n=1 Tax=Dracunculus medinensis TaxID=318479 RepID=A0A0N4UEZ2_DRAME|nr:unnamed protein product [Dracunculus medinensis]
MIQARQECLLNEEKDVINRGVDNANKLLAWYNDRLKSLEKRSELLKKGMVLLNPAVQEQKFDYLRAHISELNRRITSLIKTSEYGFPTHTNLQMRAQMPPVNDNRSNYLQKQNKVLSQELIDKEKIIDQLLKGKSGMLDNKIEKPKSQTNGNICVRTARVRPVFQKIASQTVPNSPSVRMQGTLM